MLRETGRPIVGEIKITLMYVPSLKLLVEGSLWTTYPGLDNVLAHYSVDFYAERTWETYRW